MRDGVQAASARLLLCLAGLQLIRVTNCDECQVLGAAPPRHATKRSDAHCRLVCHVQQHGWRGSVGPSVRGVLANQLSLKTCRAAKYGLPPVDGANACLN